MLRHGKDVQFWKPQVTIIGITSLELKRLAWICKLLNPYWSGDPFVYPRLVLTNGTPSFINQPTPTPAEIIAHTSINEMPNIDQDSNYHYLDWERPGLWSLLQKSYLFRLLTSINRHSREPGREKLYDKERMFLSRHVLSALVRQVREDVSIPLIVYLPYQFELRKATEIGNKYIPLSVQALRQAGIDHVDTTGCLLEAKAIDEYMPGEHYSPKAHAAIAKCLEPILRQELSRLNH